MRLTDRHQICSYLLAATLLSMWGCRTAGPSLSVADLWSIETSKALDDACRRDDYTATAAEVTDEAKGLGKCINDPALARRWMNAVQTRIENNWPTDYPALGAEKVKCLEGLTNGVMARLGARMRDFCKKRGSDATRQMIASETSEFQDPKCTDLVRMTPEGCFVEAECPSASSNSVSARTKPRKTRVMCHDGVKKIHRIKDPKNQNLAWNEPFAIELSGLQSYAHVTYGPPNCHGTAQAVAGELLGDLQLEDVMFARLADEPRCGKQAREFVAANKDKKIAELALNPGGLLINMKHEDCTASQCGKVQLWVDHCVDGAMADQTRSSTQPFESAVFIEDMCVECWAGILAKKGLIRTDESARPGCIFTTYDHSVFIVHRSAGFCFAYEATSPYGPPQLRASPCRLLDERFKNHFCPVTTNLPAPLP